MNAPVVGFAGLSHLGLISAVCAAEKGFRTLAFDPDADRVRALRAGELPLSEPGLRDLMVRNRERLTFTGTAAELAACDVVYVSADVPTASDGRSDLRPIHALLDAVSAAARPTCALVVLSQVPPGFTRGRFDRARPLFYQVETLVFGQAVARALQPERYIVGCADPAEPLSAAYAAFLAADSCPVLRLRYESAEMAKISINLYLATAVSTTNTLAELCEAIGADWSEIAPALRLDRRIGPHAYLDAGLGIAGGNLERDLATLTSLAEHHGTDAGLVQACVANSARRRDWAAQAIAGELLDEHPGAVVAVWGLAYKANTDSITGSPSVATLSRFADARFRAHDPVFAASRLGLSHVAPAADPLDAAAGAEALMILTPWPQYREIPPAAIAHRMRGSLVVDPYRVLDAHAAEAAGLRVRSLGRAAAPGVSPRC